MEQSEVVFAKFLEDWLEHSGIPSEYLSLIKLAILLLGMLVIAFVLWKLGQLMVNLLLHRLAKKTSTNLDDILYEQGVFRKIGHVIPAVIISWLLPVALSDYPSLQPLANRITSVFVVVVIARMLHYTIRAIQLYLAEKPKYRDKPMESYSQLSMIIIWTIAVLIITSLVIGKNLLYMFTALGAASAVLLLIFKDTILGFIASIQLSINDMIRIGDWVSVPKSGADGDVIEINLTTVKVRNFDNTISTVPTYSFVADSFKNWRGMQESEGRRIKRAVNLKISSVQLVNEELLAHFMKIELVRQHITERGEIIAAHNARVKADTEASILNGRRMTNLGVFRAYVLRYLQLHPSINQEMTIMVRQLEPTAEGVPLEVYCFSKDKVWENYESIQADIFDHIFAAVPHFALSVFESPASSDVAALADKLSTQ